MAPKIDLGGAWAQKGRPSILNNSPMKIQLFHLRGCPRTPKIAPRIAFKFQYDFVSILTPKMGAQGLPFGTPFGPKTVREIDPDHFFCDCSPQWLPKPPKAAPRTPPRYPRDPPELRRDLPGAPMTLQGSPGRPPSLLKWSPWPPQVTPRGAAETPRHLRSRF